MQLPHTDFLSHYEKWNNRDQLMKAAYIGDSIIRMKLRLLLSVHFQNGLDLFENELNSNAMFFLYCFKNKVFIPNKDWTDKYSEKKKVTADTFEAYIYFLHLNDVDSLDNVIADYYNFFWDYKKAAHKISSLVSVSEGFWPKHKKLHFVCPLMQHLKSSNKI